MHHKIVYFEYTAFFYSIQNPCDFKVYNFHQNKMTNNLLPNYLSSLVPCSVSARTTYSLRNKEDISLMYCSTTRFQNSFFPSAIRAWNLPPVNDVRNSSSVANFKLKVGRIFSREMKCKLFEVGSRYASILHTRKYMHAETLALLTKHYVF